MYMYNTCVHHHRDISLQLCRACNQALDGFQTRDLSEEIPKVGKPYSRTVGFAQQSSVVVAMCKSQLRGKEDDGNW